MPQPGNLSLDFLENHGEIVPTEPECVAEGNRYITFLSFVERHVEIRVEVRIVCKMVDGRWNDRLGDREQTGDTFNSSSCSEQVTSHC